MAAARSSVLPGIRARAQARGRRPRSRTKAAPIEYTILYTATLCLLAGGAVMVYSASSAESLLGGSGDPSYYLKRYVVFAAIGLVAAAFPLATGPERHARRDPADPRGRLRADGGRDAARDRHRGQRSKALARRRADPVPTCRAAEGRARPLRGAAAHRAPVGDALAVAPGQPPAADRRRRLRAAARAAGHGNGARDLPHDRRAPRGRRCAAPQPGDHRRRARRGGARRLARGAVPPGSSDRFPRPVGRRGRQWLPDRAGDDRDRLRRVRSGSGSASRCRRSSTCRRPTPT